MSNMTKLSTTTPIPVQLSGPEFIAFIFPHLSMPMRGPKCKLGYHRVFNLILWVLYTGVAVGDRVTPAPPRRSRRAAFPHRAPVEGRTRSKFGAWAAHTPSIRRLAASVTHQVRRCVRDVRCRSPFLRPAAFPPPSPPPI